MFSKTDKKSQKGSEATAKPAPPSIVSADLRIVGDLHSEGEVHIDGVVEGDIRSKILLVGESAKVKGEIVSEVVNVHGSVNGQIKATSVILKRTAHVTGDILHENLAIEKGAFFEGHCRRIDAREETGGRINLVVKDGDVGTPEIKTDPQKIATPS